MALREVTSDDIEYTKRIVQSMPCAHKQGIEDAIGYGLLGLWQAVLKFDGRGEFRTFATPRIKGAVLDGARKNDHLTRPHRDAVNGGALPDPQFPLSIESLVEREAGGAVYSLPDESLETADHAALRLTLEPLVIAMEGQRGAVLRLWFFQRWTQAEIAEFFSVTPGRISGVMREALDELWVALTWEEAA